MNKLKSAILMIIAIMVIISCGKKTDVVYPKNTLDFHVTFSNLSQKTNAAAHLDGDTMLYVPITVGNRESTSHWTSGLHTVQFTTNMDTTLEDRQDFKPGSYMHYYFMDDEDPADRSIIRHRLLLTDDSEPTQTDKMGIRFVHASPDAGKLAVFLLQKNKGKKQLQLIQYNEASPYYFLSQNDTVSNNVIPFIIYDSVDKTEIPVGATFVPGFNYAVEISGFKYAKKKYRAGSSKLEYTTTPIVTAQIKFIKMH